MSWNIRNDSLASIVSLQWCSLSLGQYCYMFLFCYWLTAASIKGRGMNMYACGRRHWRGWVFLVSISLGYTRCVSKDGEDELPGLVFAVTSYALCVSQPNFRMSFWYTKTNYISKRRELHNICLWASKHQNVYTIFILYVVSRTLGSFLMGLTVLWKFIIFCRLPGL